MDRMKLDVKLLFFLVSIATLATCQQQNRSSIQSVQQFQSRIKLTNRLWALWRRKSWKSGKVNENGETTESARLTEKRLNNLKSKIPTHIGVEGSLWSSGKDLSADYKNYFAQRQIGTTSTTTNVTLTTLACGTIAAAAAAVAIAVALGVAVPTSLQAASQSNSQNSAQQANLQNLFGGGGGGVGLGDNQTPTNNLPLPVNGIDFQDDGCGDGSVRFGDGNCYSVLKRGPCADPHRWLTVDPIQLQVIQFICENIETNLKKDAFQGQCTPRLCGRGRVFVGRDGLCHDVNDPLECQGGRRLYYSSYGDSICDCPIGQYPFPNVQDDCVPLFTQGIARKINFQNQFSEMAFD